MSDSDTKRGGRGAEPTPGLATRRAPRPSMARRLRLPLLIGAPVLVLIAGFFVYLTGGRYQSTDDAYIQSARASTSAPTSPVGFSRKPLTTTNG